MLKPHGYAYIVNPDSPGLMRLDDPRAKPEQLWEGTTELDTFQCGHCGRHHHVRPRQRPEDIGGLCKQCMRAICPTCVDTGRCEPLEKKLAMAEERDRTRRSYGI